MLEEVMKKYSGVRLTRGDRFMLWADDTSQWEVYDRRVNPGRRVVPLVLATGDLADALKKFTEGLSDDA